MSSPGKQLRRTYFPIYIFLAKRSKKLVLFQVVTYKKSLFINYTNCSKLTNYLIISIIGFMS